MNNVEVNLDEMNPAERKRHLAKIRQQKYMADPANRAKHNERRRAVTALAKKYKMEQAKQNNNITPTIEPVEPVNKVIQSTPAPAPAPAQKKKKIRLIYRNITYEKLLALLDKYKFEKQKTKETYMQSLKRLQLMINCTENNYIECLNDYKNVIEKVNNAVQKNLKLYGSSSKKSVYQLILWMVDNLNIKISDTIKQKYKDEFEVKKVENSDENKTIQENKEIIPMSKYLGQIKKTHGVNSMAHVISSLYNEVPVRDDFQLEIVKKEKDAVDNTKNYYVANTNPKIILHVYKTSKKYGKDKYDISPKLKTMIDKYMKSNNIKVGDYLFGDKKLSAYITKMNNEAGYEFSINEFRHMKASELYNNPKTTARDKLLLSKLMKHSPEMGSKYVRHKMVF